METSTLEPLCAMCGQVQIDPDQLPRSGTWTLGTFAQVSRRRCPLCQLVTRVLNDAQQLNSLSWLGFEHSSPVVLKWQRSPQDRKDGCFLVGGTEESFSLCLQSNRDADADATPRNQIRCVPSVPPMIDVARIRSWLGRCGSEHESVCYRHVSNLAEAFPGIKFFRLIDVVRMCVVTTHSIPKYVALSYIWGAVETTALSKANLERLSVPGGLLELRRELPRTVADAIQVVRTLGLAYLWVDSLCLVQNDAAEVELGVGLMDRIYELAFLTIVAADGHDANAGLAGVRTASRMEMTPTPITGRLSLGIVPTLDKALCSTVYATRGWTFQEQYLSRRCIFFVRRQLYFRCNVLDQAEVCFDSVAGIRSLNSSVRSLSSSIRRPTLLTEALRFKDPKRDFATIIQEYSRRQFSKDSDIAKAAAGFLRRLSLRMGGHPIFHGIPLLFFERGLLFRGAGCHLRRRPGFPSYSWMGWRGGVRFSDGLNYAAFIVFYESGPDAAAPRRLALPSQRETSRIDVLMEEQARRSVPCSTPWVGWTELAISLRSLSLQTEPSSTRQFRHDEPSYPRLHFWTLAVYYEIGNIDTETGHGKLFGQNAYPAGDVELDGFRETDFSSERPFEVILIITRDLYDPGALILESHDGFSERRGIARIADAGFVHSFSPGPLWKEITLG